MKIAPTMIVLVVIAAGAVSSWSSSVGERETGFPGEVVELSSSDSLLAISVEADTFSDLVIEEFDQTPVQAWRFGAHRITALQFSEAGDYLALGASARLDSTAARIIVRNTSTWAEVANISLGLVAGLVGEIHDLAFSSDGSRLAAATNVVFDDLLAGFDQRLVVWNTSDWSTTPAGILDTLLPSDATAFLAVEFGPDGESIGIGSNAIVMEPFTVWSTSDWSRLLLGDLIGGNQHTGSVNAVVRVPNYMITGSDDTTLKVWSTIDWTLLSTLTGHTAPVTSITVAENEVISLGTDTSARTWSLDPPSNRSVIQLSENASAGTWDGHNLEIVIASGPSLFSWARDLDSDGVRDSEDGCTLTAGNATFPEDSKGCPDSDGDGWANSADSFLMDGTQWNDTDLDGFGDNSAGTEGDSCPTEPGTSHEDRFGCVDSDGDGWSDHNDAYPEDDRFHEVTAVSRLSEPMIQITVVVAVVVLLVLSFLLIQKIRARVHLSQTHVHGDVIGSKVEIHDSVVQGSDLSGSVSLENASVDGDVRSTEITAHDSVVMTTGDK